MTIRKKKTKKALWTQAFPEQMQSTVSTRDLEKAFYKVIAPIFKAMFPRCKNCTQPTEHVHHKRGKTGVLMIDTRFFVNLCFECHRWSHDSIWEAQQKDLMCSSGQWGRVPVDSHAFVNNLIASMKLEPIYIL